MIENNIAEELETPKLPKRIPKYLTLEEFVRLLISCNSSSRDHCIITIFLNSVLRIAELASLNIEQVSTDVLTVIGKGNKERKIFLTPAAKKSISQWLQIRNSLDVSTNALFVSRNKRRLSIQILLQSCLIRKSSSFNYHFFTNKISPHIRVGLILFHNLIEITYFTIVSNYHYYDDMDIHIIINSLPLYKHSAT